MALNKIYPKSESVCVLLAAQDQHGVLSIDLFSLITGLKLFHWSFHYRSRNM